LISELADWIPGRPYSDHSNIQGRLRGPILLGSFQAEQDGILDFDIRKRCFKKSPAGSLFRELAGQGIGGTREIR